MRKTVVFALIAFSLAPSPALPTARAQAPASAAASLKDPQAAFAAWEALNKKLADLPQKDPAKAIEQLKAFWEQNPELSEGVALRACARIAELYHAGLKDDKSALETCDWALKEYQHNPAKVRLTTVKARIFLDDKKAGEAETALKKDWDYVVRATPEEARAALEQYRLALAQQGKEAELGAALKISMAANPGMLTDDPWSPGEVFYDQLMDRLLEQKRFDEALSYARMRFALCSYDEGSIDRAAKMLHRAWTAKDPTQKPLRKFGQAQVSKVALPSNLSDIPMPEMDAATLAAQLSAAKGKEDWKARNRVTIYLLSGNLREAMVEAQQMLADFPDRPDGVREVCRVFKAADLNLTRASAYLEFKKTGQGTDPLAEFYRAHPPTGTRTGNAGN